MLNPWEATGFFRLRSNQVEVLTADTLGFCGGVERAVAMAKSTLERSVREGRKLYLYGGLVHNSFVCSYFSARGAETIRSAEDADEGSIIVIRAHGLTDRERSILISRNVEIVDCTCPVVLRGQDLVRSSYLPVLIFGYTGHSEAVTLVGSTADRVSIISSPEDLDRVEKGEYNGVVQTTFSATLLRKILEKAGEKGIMVNVLNHICQASVERRKSVLRLLERVDCLVVVGDRNSANTKELAALADKRGFPCFLVGCADDIPRAVYDYERVGITAGASTPEEVFRSVKEKLEV